MNGRGIAAMSPLPPGIFGYLDGESGINPVVYDWGDGQPKRKPVEVAKALLAEAGWPNGRHAKTGEPLVLYLDTTSGGMGDKSRLDWLTRQFAKLDIQLVVRATDINRFYEKTRKGAVQLYFLGWNADYPDPENFFFLLLGSEGKVAKMGENVSNYASAEFDRLFAQMKDLDNGPRRQALIDRMNRLLQDTTRRGSSASIRRATRCAIPGCTIASRVTSVNNGLKYQRLDVAERERRRAEWNEPVLMAARRRRCWVLLAAGSSAIAGDRGAVRRGNDDRRRERATARTRGESPAFLDVCV